MDFGKALSAMKAGKKVTRQGWNGKGMWAALGGQPTELDADKFWNEHNKSFAKENGGKAVVRPYFTLKTAQDDIMIGWNPSQSDILAEDWVVID